MSDNPEHPRDNTIPPKSGGYPRAKAGMGLQFQCRLNAELETGKRYQKYVEAGWNDRDILERLLELDINSGNPVPLSDNIPETVLSVLTAQNERLAINVDRIENIMADIRANGGVATREQLNAIGDEITAEFEENMRSGVRGGFANFDDES